MYTFCVRNGYRLHTEWIQNQLDQISAAAFRKNNCIRCRTRRARGSEQIQTPFFRISEKQGKARFSVIPFYPGLSRKIKTGVFPVLSSTARHGSGYRNRWNRSAGQACGDAGHRRRSERRQRMQLRTDQRTRCAPDQLRQADKTGDNVTRI